jgi:hypothetical protein
MLIDRSSLEREAGIKAAAAPFASVARADAMTTG